MKWRALIRIAVAIFGATVVAIMVQPAVPYPNWCNNPDLPWWMWLLAGCYLP